VVSRRADGGLLLDTRRLKNLTEVVTKTNQPSDMGPYTSDLDETGCNKKLEDMPGGHFHGPEAREGQLKADMRDFPKSDQYICNATKRQALWKRVTAFKQVQDGTLP
jgi:hypothetical protein